MQCPGRLPTQPNSHLSRKNTPSPAPAELYSISQGMQSLPYFLAIIAKVATAAAPAIIKKQDHSFFDLALNPNAGFLAKTN